MKKWDTMLILIRLLQQKLRNQYQAAKAVVVVTIVEIPLSSFRKYQKKQQQRQQFQQLEIHAIFTPRLAGVYDRCKITDRNYDYILTACVKVFICDTENLVINLTSFQRLRKKILREARHTEIQLKFNLNNCQELVLNWDGKLLPAFTGFENIDRVAIIVTFQGKEQILGVSEIPISSEEREVMGAYQEVGYNRQNSGTL